MTRATPRTGRKCEPAMGFRVQAYGPEVTSRLGGSLGVGGPRAPAKREKHHASPPRPTTRKATPPKRPNAGSVGRPSPRSSDRPAGGTPRQGGSNSSEN